MELKDLLGGYNCGGCGYDNCEECALAILKGDVDPSICMLLEEGKLEEIEQFVKESKKNNKDK